MNRLVSALLLALFAICVTADSSGRFLDEWDDFFNDVDSFADDIDDAFSDLDDWADDWGLTEDDTWDGCTETTVNGVTTKSCDDGSSSSNTCKKGESGCLCSTTTVNGVTTESCSPAPTWLGPVIGVVIILIIIGCAAWCCYRCYKKTKSAVKDAKDAIEDLQKDMKKDKKKKKGGKHSSSD